MKFKGIEAWQIVLFGSFYQFILGVREAIASDYLCSWKIIVEECRPLSTYSHLGAISGFISLIPISGLIISALLYYDMRKRFIGVILISGFIWGIFGGNFFLALFLIIAGIYHKKSIFSEIPQILQTIKKEGIMAWHIVLAGVILQIIIGAGIVIIGNSCSGDCDIAFGAILAGVSTISISGAIAVIPMILLRNESTKRTGAIACIVMALLPLLLVLIMNYLEHTNPDVWKNGTRFLFAIYSYSLPVIISFIAAGVFYFQKKK